MKVREAKGGRHERAILTGLITNKTVLAAVSDRWNKDGLFENRWSNLIAGWCVNYFRKYRKPPKSQIEHLFSKWEESREGRDKDVVSMVSTYLQSLSRQYDRQKVQVDYLVDLAGEYFTKVRATKLRDRIDGLIEDGKVKDAVEAIRKFDEIELVDNEGFVAGIDTAQVEKAFDKTNTQVLIPYPGAAGVFFGDILQRDSFISFLSPEKRGKTWWLIDMAWRGMLAGHNVVFFEVGDLSENQIIRRFGQRASQLPYRDKEYRYPISLSPSGGKLPEISHKLVNPKKIVNAERAKRAFHRWVIDGNLRIITRPNNSITANGVNSILHKLRQYNQPADIVLIDYAALLAPIDPKEDPRQRVDTTWKTLRAISQEHHCLLLTVEQTKATAYDKETLGMEDFSENKLTNAHVTAKIGINVTDEERRLGLYRLNWLFKREDEYDPDLFLWTAPCLPIGHTCLHSVFNFGSQGRKKRGNRSMNLAI